MKRQSGVLITRAAKRNGKAAVRLTPVAAPGLELAADEARQLNAWADNERAAGRTKVLESPAVYAAHVRARR